MQRISQVVCMSEGGKRRENKREKEGQLKMAARLKICTNFSISVRDVGECMGVTVNVCVCVIVWVLANRSYCI